MLITAAIPNLIQSEDINHLNFKIIVSGSNIPTTQENEELIYKKNILMIPDFVANAGGVISSYVEYKGGNEKEMFMLVEQKITENTKLILQTAQKKKCSPRSAALEIAKQRVLEKCKNCKQ